MLKTLNYTQNKITFSKPKTNQLQQDIRNALDQAKQYSLSQNLNSRIKSLNNNVNRFLKSYIGNYNKNEFSQIKQSVLVLQVNAQSYNNQEQQLLDFQPKLFRDCHQNLLATELLYKFQIFMIKESQEISFHYFKFLKGISDKNNNRNISGTLKFLNEFFTTVKLKTQDYINFIKRQSISQYDDVALLSDFVKSQNYQNLQVLIITRIIMKQLLHKVFKDIKISKENMQKLNENNLEKLLEFYELVGYDLQKIESILEKGGQTCKAEFQILKVYPFMTQQYKNIIKQSYDNEYNHVSFKGFQNVLLTIAEMYMGELNCENELTNLLTQRKIDTKNQSPNTKLLAKNLSFETQGGSDDENLSNYSTPRKQTKQTKFDLISSDSQDSQQTELLDSSLSELSDYYVGFSDIKKEETSVSDFFGGFHYSLLSDEIFNDKSQQSQ